MKGKSTFWVVSVWIMETVMLCFSGCETKDNGVFEECSDRITFDYRGQQNNALILELSRARGMSVRCVMRD